MSVFDSGKEDEAGLPRKVDAVQRRPEAKQATRMQIHFDRGSRTHLAVRDI